MFVCSMALTVLGIAPTIPDLPTVKAQRRLVLPQATTVWVQRDLRLESPASSLQWGMIKAQKSTQGTVEVLPWVQVLGVSRGRIRVRYALRTHSGPGLEKVAKKPELIQFKLEIWDILGSTAYANTLSHRIVLKKSPTQETSTSELAQQTKVAQQHLMTIRRQHPLLMQVIHVGAPLHPPAHNLPRGLSKEVVEEWLMFQTLASALRHQLASQALSGQEPLASQAYLALGQLLPGQLRMRFSKRQDKNKILEQLDLAARRLDLNFITNATDMLFARPDLTKAEFSKIYWLRTLAEGANPTPDLDVFTAAASMLPMEEAFKGLPIQTPQHWKNYVDKIQGDLKFNDGPLVKEVMAAETQDKEGHWMEIEVISAKDPVHLVKSGAAIFVDESGTQQFKVPLQTSDDQILRGKTATANVPKNLAGDIRLEVKLQSAGGVELASWGPQIVPVELRVKEEQSSFEVPTWAWWALGGAAVAGAAVAIGVAATDNGIERGIGPTVVRF